MNNLIIEVLGFLSIFAVAAIFFGLVAASLLEGVYFLRATKFYFKIKKWFLSKIKTKTPVARVMIFALSGILIYGGIKSINDGLPLYRGIAILIVATLMSIFAVVSYYKED